jgi:hypothetical protein
MITRNFLGCSVLLMAGALTGCQHAGVAPIVATAASTPPAPAPQAAATSTPAPIPGTSKPTAEEPSTPDASPFIEGVRLGYPAQLSVVGKSALLGAEHLLFGIHDDRVTIDPALLEGLRRGDSSFPRVLGSMPDSAWSVDVSYMERTSHSTLSRFNGTEWQSADSILRGRNVIGISMWSGGRTLALVGDEYANQLDFVQLAGTRNVPLPQLDYVAKSNMGCVHGIAPMAMSALPSGEVFLVGTRCTVTDDDVAFHDVVVERWGAGQARGKVSVLPRLAKQEASAQLTSVVAASGNDVLVAGIRTPVAPDGTDAKDEAYLAHFDGHTWSAVPAPPTDHLDELQRAPDGKLWALANGELWTTINGAESITWERVPMPRFADETGVKVSSLWVQDTGAVWVTVGTDDFSYLLRTKRGAAPLSAPSDAQVSELASELDPAAAYNCESPTLVLLTLSRQAPKDADMPSVRAALRGHPELEGKAEFVELPFLTRRYLAVRGDSDTLSRTMEAVTRAHIPGVDPELRCINAEPTRVLQMDFSGPQPSAAKAAAKAAHIPNKKLDREPLDPRALDF